MPLNVDINNRQCLNYTVLISPPTCVPVYGVIFSHQTILDQVTTVVEVCRDHENIACHLLDDGAFLVATNQPNLNTSVSTY